MVKTLLTGRCECVKYAAEVLFLIPLLDVTPEAYSQFLYMEPAGNSLFDEDVIKGRSLFNISSHLVPPVHHMRKDFFDEIAGSVLLV